MKKFIALSSLGFYLLAFIFCFVVGAYVAGKMGAGENQGLAGGAIVLGWGVLVGLGGIVLAIILVQFLSPKVIIKINWVLLIVAVVFLIFLYAKARISTEKNKEAPQPSLKTTSPTAMLVKPNLQKSSAPENSLESSPKGIGIFRPAIMEHGTLYFYGPVNWQKSSLEHHPTDSIVFAMDAYNNPTTTYAPPWLYPEHLKLDYGVLIFKVLGVGDDFLKVEVNKLTQQTSYVNKAQGSYLSFPEFLTSVNSVEFINSNSKVYLKPFDASSTINTSFSFMDPLLIEEDWMYVALLNESYETLGKGWIQWKKDGKLMISYSLFS
ncbi:MAG: hypothetical protein R2773_07160 [Flavobacteriaceae bacterium]